MEDRLLSIKEAALLLGVKEKTLYQWKWQQRLLRFVKIGKSLRIREKDLADFIRKHTAQPTEQNAKK